MRRARQAFPVARGNRRGRAFRSWRRPDRLRLLPGSLLRCLLMAGLLSAAMPALAGVDAAALPDDWLTLRAGATRILFHEDDSPVAGSLSRAAPVVRQRVAGALGTDASSALDVVLVPRRPEDAAEVPIPPAPDWAAGFTVAGSDVVFIRAGKLGIYPHRDVLSIFAHELGHAELARIARGRRLPRWFEEGTCMVLARPWDLRDAWSLTLAVLFRDAAGVLAHDREFPQTGGEARAAYAQSFALVQWLAAEHGGPQALGQVARQVAGGRSFPGAFVLQFGMTPETAVSRWRHSMGRWYRTVTMVTSTAALWAGILALLFVVAVGQRRRRRRILARWAEEEAAAGEDPAGRGQDNRPLKPH